jgi:hypothetical protein
VVGSAQNPKKQQKEMLTPVQRVGYEGRLNIHPHQNFRPAGALVVPAPNLRLRSSLDWLRASIILKVTTMLLSNGCNSQQFYGIRRVTNIKSAALFLTFACAHNPRAR